MEFLYFLEDIRNPVLDTFFSIITHLGSEVVFMAMAVALYWCFSRSEGLYVLSVGYFGTVINQFLKLAYRIPRPWVKDPSFTIVESARADATGYSFPSGHTQNVCGTMGSFAMLVKKRWVQITVIVLALLTSLSRMYLGVHTPLDVGVSLGVSVILVVGLRPLFRDIESKPGKFYGILAAMFLFGLAFVCYAEFWNFPADLDAENHAHAIENSYKLLGVVVGMAIGYTIDLKWVHFKPQATWLGQLLKIVLGLAIVIGLKSGLKVILGGSDLMNALRYCLMIVFAAGIWPMTFPWFAKLGRKKAQ